VIIGLCTVVIALLHGCNTPTPPSEAECVFNRQQSPPTSTTEVFNPQIPNTLNTASRLPRVRASEANVSE
jgi:hypothetical protein